jgi:hypothetical protein
LYFCARSFLPSHSIFFGFCFIKNVSELILVYLIHGSVFAREMHGWRREVYMHAGNARPSSVWSPNLINVLKFCCIFRNHVDFVVWRRLYWVKKSAYQIRVLKVFGNSMELRQIIVRNQATNQGSQRPIPIIFNKLMFA